MEKRTSAELKRLAREFLAGSYAVPMMAAVIVTSCQSFYWHRFLPGALIGGMRQWL